MKELRSSIKVQLVGGLGNQLFCYSFGKYLERLGHKVIFDTSEVDRGYTKHGVFLESLDLEGDFRNVRKELGIVRYILRRVSFAAQVRLRTIKWPTWASPAYTAEEVGWSQEHEKHAQPGVTLRGYFATYKYFQKSKEIFGNNLQPRKPSFFYTTMREELQSERWIAVHVRRGDYVGLQNLYGLCGPRYFRSAFSAIPDKDKYSRVVVFSDDLNEARELLRDAFSIPAVFIEPPTESGAEESLLLMSLASAHIISNSSFSLWAALLSNGTDAVFYPDPWHKGMDTPSELVPPNWKPIRSDFS